MFENEYRVDKVYMRTGTSLLANKDYMPQVSAMFGNYAEGNIMTKEDMNVMLQYLTPWRKDKRERILKCIVDCGVLVDSADEAAQDVAFELGLDDNYYIDGYFAKAVRENDGDLHGVMLRYKSKLVINIPMKGDTMFDLLERQDDMLFKVYAFLGMNHSYWTKVQKTPYMFSSGGNTGIAAGLGYSSTSSSVRDHIEQCLVELKVMGLIDYTEFKKPCFRFGRPIGYRRMLTNVGDSPKTD